jgi:pimeloyl-ACP methyl ester carboxylesterase
MVQIQRLYLDVAGIRLCCVDFGGNGPPILLLHGLAGRGDEWWSTASWLADSHHVFALDQRGHGMSEKTVQDFSRDAYVQDVISVLEQLKLYPAILVGQSLGGLNAFLAAACRPDLVRGLIVAEATPARNPRAQDGMRAWLSSWPLPFPTLAHAREFFGGDTLYAQTWVEVLEEHADGYWPQFAAASMLQSIADVTEQDYWREWEQIRCPALVVGGESSFVSQDDLRDMARRIPHGRFRQVANAGHDLHLEQPAAWRQVVTEYVQELGDSAPST